MFAHLVAIEAISKQFLAFNLQLVAQVAKT